MEKRIEIILKTIELLRVQLSHLIEDQSNLTDEKVIKKSEELDKLIVEYYQILKKQE